MAVILFSFISNAYIEAINVIKIKSFAYKSGSKCYGTNQTYLFNGTNPSSFNNH
jgi:hypothetical protein